MHTTLSVSLAFAASIACLFMQPETERSDDRRPGPVEP